jgi:anti-sigma regulatory factor (Ser/Thr protein kinase)
MGRLAEWLDRQEFRLGIPTNVAFALRQCLEEAVVNLIDYTPVTEGEDIAVELGWQGDLLVATVEDPGPPFDLLSAPVPIPAISLELAVPGGWGIHLIRCFADQIGYETAGGRNRLTLGFSRFKAAAEDFP